MCIIRKELRLLLTACLMAVIFSVGMATLLSQQPVARAATNGQQIHFTCDTPMGQVIIQGHNQNGDYVTWQGEGARDEIYVSQVFTEGWWWKEEVTIHWYGTDVSKWYTNTYYVNPGGVWPGDESVYLGCYYT